MFGGIVRLMAEVGNFSANYTIERIEYDSMMTKGYQMSGIDFKLTEAFQAGAWLTKNFEAVLTFCQARLVLAITAGEENYFSLNFIKKFNENLRIFNQNQKKLLFCYFFKFCLIFLKFRLIFSN